MSWRRRQRRFAWNKAIYVGELKLEADVAGILGYEMTVVLDNCQ